MKIESEDYVTVECDEPLPCPFCGATPTLAQLSHVTRSERIGRTRKYRQVSYCLVAYTKQLVANTFWFKCDGCNCTTGGHHRTAQAAAEAWNRRVIP